MWRQLVSGLAAASWQSLRRASSQHLPAGFVVSDEVASALAAQRPVVALESTIISHGMVILVRMGPPV